MDCGKTTMEFFPQKIRNRRGFTMIEVICALLVVGIIAAIVASRRVAIPTALIVELETLKSHLRYAQYKALSDLPGTTWGIKLNAGNYTLYRNGAAATIGLPGEKSGTPPRTHTYSSGVTMTSITPTGISAATFDFLGRPVDASSNPLNASIGITLSRQGVTRTFTIILNTGFVQ
jgi:prepilin-type N-terminal cleavage/methylation domain-containing protein